MTLSGRLAALGTVTAVVLLGGFVAHANVGAANRSQDPSPHYAKNLRGMTYGSALNATSPETEPDLIQATGVGGVEGYVRKVDLVPASPQTPADAVSRAVRSAARVIPLYAQNGVTVIGRFALPAPTRGVVTNR